MVYDGAVKDQESSAGPTPSAAVSEASSASEAVVSARPARPAHDKLLGVRHPLKHRRFRAGGKMMVEPGGGPSTRAVAVGEEEEEEEEEASEVEEEDGEETTSAETEMPSVDVEVSSAPAPVVSVLEDMQVEGGEMELSPEAAIELEACPGKEQEEAMSSLVAAQGEGKQEPAASVPASGPPNDRDEDKEREEKERKERETQKERERVDEVGYMSGGWKR